MMNDEQGIRSAPHSSLIIHHSSLLASLRLFTSDIKISHTIFAMPWAILSTILAWHRVGGPLLGKLVLIVVCMITARTAAMASNRLLDAELDKRNPRTARRAIPSGQLSPKFVTLILAACAFAFIATTALFQ